MAGIEGLRQMNAKVIILLPIANLSVARELQTTLRAKLWKCYELVKLAGLLWACGLCLSSSCAYILYRVSACHTYSQELRLTLRPTPLTATGGDATWHFAVRRNIAQIFDDDTCRAAAYCLPTGTPQAAHTPPHQSAAATLPDIVASKRGKRKKRKTKCGKCDESFE